MMQKQIKEHPILFSGEMVRAILANKKTQTRRVITPQPKIEIADYNPHRTFGVDWNSIFFKTVGDFIALKCPYGVKGDRLWVRETWRAIAGCQINYAADDDTKWVPERSYAMENLIEIPAGKWHSPIHMSRWASRITLEIVNVRVERVMQITDDDALAEGIDRTNASIAGYPRERFKRLWDSINAKRGYAWDANPWVWVVEFKKL